MASEQVKAVRRAVSGQDKEPVTLQTDPSEDKQDGGHAPAHGHAPEIGAGHVIAALRRQITELSWRLAVAEAEVAQRRGA